MPRSQHANFKIAGGVLEATFIK